METSAIAVKIPLLNPNEPDAKIVSLAVKEGQFVKEGDIICTLETTKSTADVNAEHNGFVIGLLFSVGETVTAGAQLCYLSENENWKPDFEPMGAQEGSSAETHAGIPTGLRISKPALNLAQSNNLDLNQLPIGPLVTENLVRELIDKSPKPVRDFRLSLSSTLKYSRLAKSPRPLRLFK